MKPSTPKTELPQSTQLRKAVLAGAPKKARLLLFSIAVLLAGGAAAVRGQSALDGFDPNPNNQILAIVMQPDGKVLIGGQFTTLSPNGGSSIARPYIARLNPDGTVDTAFNPHPDVTVRAIALQADGKIVIGGDFNHITPNGGSPIIRNYIARLNADGTLDLGFDPWTTASVLSLIVQPDGKILVGGNFNHFFPNASSPGFARSCIARLDTNGVPDSFNPNVTSTGSPQVISLALQPDGKVLAAGVFTNIGGAARNNIARIDPTTGLADSWNPNANTTVWTLALQADGKILAGGDFTTIGGQTRNRLARLDSTTGLADSFNPNMISTVNSLALQADGKILAGGAFTFIGGNAHGRMARFDPVTGLPDSYDPSPNFPVNVITVLPDSKVLIGGSFSIVTPNGGDSVLRNCIARLETDGRLDQTLNPDTVGGMVYATAVQPDGKFLIGGSFTSVLGVARNRIARLNTDGTLDTAFNPNASGFVYSIAVQPDGKILVGGTFNIIGGQARSKIARLDATTGLADSWNPNAGGGYVGSILVQADGKILVCGSQGFTSIGGQPRNGLARLDPMTGLADSWNPSAVGLVFSIAVQADGKILVVGGFDPGTTGMITIGGQPRKCIARLDPETGLADSFDPHPNGDIRAIAVQPDGKILVGGAFYDNPVTPGQPSIGGQTRNHIARLDPATGLADSWDPNAGNVQGVFASIFVQADGNILVAGSFTTIGGQTRNHIARLDPVTGLADSFDPNPNGNGVIGSIAAQADGKVLVGGDFTNIGGQTRGGFARLSNDTAALQNLDATQNTVTWTRGGSSPQLTSVTFESSTDNVSYTPLGNGTVAGSNWTLTGLNLPTGQNIYIRARGFYSGGFFNGSQSITESVRNAFLATPPPLLNIQRSGNTNIVLSWATNFTGFTLEANTNLNTNVWSDVSPAPSLTGTNNVVTNAVSGSARFYRLHK